MEEKKWFDMTYDEIINLMPLEKRRKYKEEYMWTFRHILNPLYMSVLNVVGNKRFKFSANESVTSMKMLLTELMDQHYNAGFTRDQIIQSILDKRLDDDGKRKKR